MVAPFARRRTSQPQSPTPIDWGNPLTAGLVSWMLPSDGAWSNTNGVGFNYAAPHGVSRNFVAASSQGLTKGVAHGQAVTFFALARRATTGINEAFVSSGASTNDRRLLYVTSGDDLSMFVGSGATTRQATWSTTVAANQVRAYAGTDNGATCTVWADGLLRATGATSSFSVAAPTTAAVGAYYTSGALTAGFYLRGDVFVAAIWDRVLSRPEIESLSANPWQIFANNTPIKPLYLPSGGGTQELLPDLFTNTQTFYAPTVSAGAVTLTPSLFTNGQTFYSPTVTPGAVTLTPDLFTNSQTFYSATVSQVSPQELLPDLFTNSQAFYAPTVTASYTLLPSLFTNGATFYGPAVTVGAVTLLPQRFTNTNTFYSATITGGAVQVRTKGLRKTRYVPRRILARRPEFEDITRSVNEEFERLNDALESPFTHQLLEVLHTEPSRKFEGMVAMADGSDWNPGSGKGVYVYYSSAWNRLG